MTTMSDAYARSIRVQREREARERETLVVRVKSETDPKREYTLHALGDVVTCNCRGYLTHSKCKHQAALVAVLKEKQ